MSILIKRKLEKRNINYSFPIRRLPILVSYWGLVIQATLLKYSSNMLEFLPWPIAK